MSKPSKRLTCFRFQYALIVHTRNWEFRKSHINNRLTRLNVVLITCQTHFVYGCREIFLKIILSIEHVT